MTTPEKDPITFGPVDKSSVGLLKIMHRELLPVHYQENIYNIIKAGQQAKGELAYYNGDTAVGEICYRLEDPSSDKDDKKDEKHDKKHQETTHHYRLYLMTLGVLPTYQRMGIATKLVNHLLDSELAKQADDVYLHVHVENEKAMKFYTHLGFQKGEMLENYYKSLENGNAYIFSKPINH